MKTPNKKKLAWTATCAGVVAASFALNCVVPPHLAVALSFFIGVGAGAFTAGRVGF